MNIVMIGPFGLKVKSTMRERALPMAKALLKKGYAVTLVIPSWDNPEDAGKHWLDENVEIVSIPLPKKKGILFHITLASWLVHYALEKEPDVIHLFKPKAYSGLAHVTLYMLRKLDRHQAKLIVDEDDWEQAWNEINDYSFAEKKLFAWQEPWGLCHADRITVASKELIGMVEELGVQSHKIHYVPNGIRHMEKPYVENPVLIWEIEMRKMVSNGHIYRHPRTKGVTPVSYNQSNPTIQIRKKYNLMGKPVVLLYTRFVEFTLTDLLTVIIALNQRLPTAHWLIVGEGFFGEEKELAKMADRHGVADKLIFTGWVPQKDLPYYFATANVAFYPYVDTLINRTKCSVKLLDLLTAGVPVVASQVGQNIEYIVHGKTGVLIPPHDLDVMTEALITILTNFDLQLKFGEATVEYVNKMFNWDKLVAEVEAAYACD
ncbi:MAG: hypothetical protein B6242_06790 [Anaerolineaceae bacterium 4572_78]|nr:MAG: hypothetical protein B6242_06790 [Anaerolineaceae bacterium 4572_78]